MEEDELTKRLSESIVDCDVEGAKEIAQKILKAGLNPIKVIKEHLTPAVRTVGNRFERGEYFLMHLMLAGEAMDETTKILTSDMSEDTKEMLESTSVPATIVVGTVRGDIHDIGKNLVSLLLRVNGFKIYDIGKDVDPMVFAEKADEVNADIIAVSALMTTTMPYQEEVLKILKEMNLKKRFKVIVGGGPTSQKWADEIGADGWATDAPGAVTLVRSMLQVEEIEP